MKNIIAVVPARGGSKGIKRKNIRKLGNKPLVYHIIDTLLKCKSIDQIIVSSEDEEIRKICSNYKNKIEILNRPSHLAKDSTPLTSVVKYVSEKVYKKYKQNIVLQVAPTCPFIKIETINKIIKLISNKNNDCVVTLKRIEHEHPYRAKKLQKNNTFSPFIKNINVEKFISRQDLPELYCTSGAIYARKYNLLKTFNEKDFCLGKKPKGIVVDEIESTNIDREIDFKFAEFIIRNKLN